MNLSQKHQVTFDEYFPDGYDASKLEKPNGKIVDESGYFHIMYIDIRKDGARTRDFPCVQKYSVNDWEKTKRVFETHSIKVTGHNEYAVIHDPIEAKRLKAAKEAAEKKAEEAKKKAEAMRAAKAEKAKAKKGEAEAEVKPEVKEPQK